MMFGVADLSTAAGCVGIPTASGPKLPKVHYGRYFSGMVADDDWREDAELKVRRRMRRAEERERSKAEGDTGGRGSGRTALIGRRLIGKLVKLLTVKDLPFMPTAKTFPCRDLKRSRKLAQQYQQQQQINNQGSPNWSQSSTFEPMPTIEEETERELIDQLEELERELIEQLLEEEADQVRRAEEEEGQVDERSTRTISRTTHLHQS